MGPSSITTASILDNTHIFSMSTCPQRVGAIWGASLVAQMVKTACSAETQGQSLDLWRSPRSPGGGNGSPFQYSCLEMDRGAIHVLSMSTCSQGVNTVLKKLII